MHISAMLARVTWFFKQFFKYIKHMAGADRWFTSFDNVFLIYVVIQAENVAFCGYF